MRPVHWFMIGLALTVLEIVLPGFVIFWFGIAGVVTGTIALFLPSVPVQIAVFVLLSGILVFSSQKIARRWIRHSPERVGSERLDGAIGWLVAPVEPPNLGMAKILGELWRAEANKAIASGTKVRVTGVVGAHVIVEPVEPIGDDKTEIGGPK